MPEVPDPAVDPLAALTAVLKKLIPNPPSVSLATPTFDWNSTEQYDNFQLFCKSVDSWFILQNIAPEIPPGDPTADINSTCLEYVLNFLGNAGHKKFDRWKPTGSDAEVVKKKKSAQEFLDYLSSTMDHAISQYPTGYINWKMFTSDLESYLMS